MQHLEGRDSGIHLDLQSRWTRSWLGRLFHELTSARTFRTRVVVCRQRKRQRRWMRKQLQSFGRERDDISLKTINVSSGSVSVVYKQDNKLVEVILSFQTLTDTDFQMTRCNICNSNNIFTSYRFGRSSRLLPPFLMLLLILSSTKYLCACLF